MQPKPFCLFVCFLKKEQLVLPDVTIFYIQYTGYLVQLHKPKYIVFLNMYSYSFELTRWKKEPEIMNMKTELLLRFIWKKIQTTREL